MINSQLDTSTTGKEENRFKIGEWAIHEPTNTLFQIKDIFTDGYSLYLASMKLEPRTKWDSGIYYGQHDAAHCRLWQPKKDEWCWFWNDDKDIPDLGKFKEINFDCNENKYLSSAAWYCYEIPEHANIFYDKWRHDWKDCEPFIGNLPSISKEH